MSTLNPTASPALSAPRAVDFFEILQVTHTRGRTEGKHRQRVGDCAYHAIAITYRDREGRATERFIGYDPTSPTLAQMDCEREMRQWLNRCEGWAAFDACTDVQS